MPSAALNAILFGPSFYPGATLALDFLAAKYRVPGVNSSTPDFASLPGLTVTRATPAVSWDTTGTYSFAANVARIVPGVGLLVEEARTNLFLNSFAPATQTVTITAQSYTITVWGTGSVTVAAGTATISNAGSVSAGSPRTIGCTVGGTITVTVTGSPSIAQVEAGAFGTSPIPTLGSSVTRAADTVSIGLTLPTNGTFYANALGSTLTTNPRVLGSDAGTAPIVFQAGTLVESYNATTNLAKAVTITAGVVVKASVAWSASGRSVTANGLVPATDANVIGAMTRMFLGSDGGSASFLNTYIQAAILYPRTDSAATQQALTN